MSRRDALPQRSARRSYVDPEEVYEDQPTRAARPSAVAAEERAPFGARAYAEPRPAIVDPLELDDASGLAPTRSPRESYVALSELPQMPSSRIAPTPAARRSYLAAVELAEGEVEEDAITSFVDRSSMVSDSELRDPAPESVTTYAARPSYVAREEQAPSYATEEQHESGPVDYEALSRFLFDDVAPPRAERPARPETPEADDADHGTLVLAPAELEAPRSYPRQPAMCIRGELAATAETPVQPLQPMPTRRSRLSIHDGEPPPHRSMPSVHPHEIAPPAFAPEPVVQPPRRSMPSVHPDVAPATFAPASFAPAPSMRRSLPSVAPDLAPAPSMRRSMPSHHAYEAAMREFAPPNAPMSSRRSMASVHPHDASASPWVVSSAPSARRRAPVAPPPFEITPSVVVATVVALVAVMLMVGGVLFVRSEEHPDATSDAFAAMPPAAETAAPVFPAPVFPSEPAASPAPPPVIVISSDDVAMPGAPAAVAPSPIDVPSPAAAPSPIAAPVAITENAPAPVVATPAPKPAAVPVVAPRPVSAPAVTTAARAPARKADAKSGGKSVEDILAELGEEQLRR